MAQPTYLTRKGLAKLQEELEHIRKTRRQEVADRIQRANSLGGTVDNAEYDEAKKEQSFIEGRIVDLLRIINKSMIIEDTRGKSDAVDVGSKVTVMNQNRGKKEKYFIVGSPEADPSKGRISNLSPIGNALLGKKIGQVAKVQVPAGTIDLEVLAIT